MAHSKQFGRDSGLQARMLLTLFLLGLVYAVLVGVLVGVRVGAITRLCRPVGVGLGLIAVVLVGSRSGRNLVEMPR